MCSTGYWVQVAGSWLLVAGGQLTSKGFSVQVSGVRKSKEQVLTPDTRHLKP
jgi:hypothetical protein